MTNSSRVLTRDMGGSCVLTEMDASRQGYAIPLCQFSRHALYMLPQMSSNMQHQKIWATDHNFDRYIHYTEIHILRYTLSIMPSIISSERFIPDSASVATTICLTWQSRRNKMTFSLLMAAFTIKWDILCPRKYKNIPQKGLCMMASV